MQAGSIVTWSSQSQGVTAKKLGQIVAVIPPGINFWRAMKDDHAEYNIGPVKWPGGRRNHESYAVAVADGDRKPKLYWPRVSALQEVTPGEND